MLLTARLQQPVLRLLLLQKQEKLLLVRPTLPTLRLLLPQKQVRLLPARLVLRLHRPLLPQKQGKHLLARRLQLALSQQLLPRQLKQRTVLLLRKNGLLTQKTP